MNALSNFIIIRYEETLKNEYCYVSQYDGKAITYRIAHCNGVKLVKEGTDLKSKHRY